VEVGADTPDLAASVQQAIPHANVRVETINGRLRLSGTVPDAIALRKALEIAEQYGSQGVINALRVTGGQQVMLEVRFIEANRNAGRELGISWYGRRLNQPPDEMSELEVSDLPMVVMHPPASCASIHHCPAAARPSVH
jgi:Flp pilus assembly secretin CpaC